MSVRWSSLFLTVDLLWQGAELIADDCSLIIPTPSYFVAKTQPDYPVAPSYDTLGTRLGATDLHGCPLHQGLGRRSGDRMRILQSLLVGIAMLGMAGSVAAQTKPPLPAEQVSVNRLPAQGPHWVYIFDEALNNEIDARVVLFDADSHRTLGQIDVGYWANIALSPDGKTTAAVTTYWSRGSRGIRTDVIEFTDNATLSVSGEVVLQPKRLQGPITPFNASFSPDQALFYVSNLTPASSITPVDLRQKTLLPEIDTDGCVLAMATGLRQVSSLCESGRLLSVTLNEAGHETARALSEPFFDVDKDPVFVQGVQHGSQLWFVSFLGDIYGVNFATGAAHFDAVWPLVSPALRGQWRPGGTQTIAVQPYTQRLYVAMHKGGEGTHKIGGSEVWAFDLKTHRRVGRFLISPQLGAVGALQVSQDADPRLYVATDRSNFLVLDPATGKILHVEPKIAQSPWYLFNP